MYSKEFARKMAFLRQLKGFTQEDMAKESGYTVGNISSFENGNNNNGSLVILYFDKILGWRLEI